jgi:hypothetical protein
MPAWSCAFRAGVGFRIVLIRPPWLHYLRPMDERSPTYVTPRPLSHRNLCARTGASADMKNQVRR